MSSPYVNESDLVEAHPPEPPTTSVRRRLSVRKILTALIAPAIGLLLSVVLIQYHGYQAFPTMLAGLQYAVGDFTGLARTIASGLPLYLGAVGVSIAFRAGLFSVGAQGQIYVGALSGAIVGAFVGPFFPPAQQALCLVAAGVAGGLVSAALGWLKARWNVDVILSSLLSNYILLLVCTLIAEGSIASPIPQAVGATRPIYNSVFFANLVPRTQLTWAIFPIVVLCFTAWWIVEKSAIGYRWRMIGQSPGFAASVGMSVSGGRIWAMALSGAFCGLTGGVVVLTGQGQFTSGIADGMGWTVIMLALIARFRPAFAVLWVTVYSIIQSASRGMQETAGVPTELSLIVLCGILFASSAAPGIVLQVVRGYVRIKRKSDG
jgi:ABC-type uncharacterized transport system permease subunit